jgi:outer membrane protein TolC
MTSSRGPHRGLPSALGRRCLAWLSCLFALGLLESPRTADSAGASASFPGRLLPLAPAAALAETGETNGRPALNPSDAEASPDSALSLALARMAGEPLSLTTAIREALDHSTDALDAAAALNAARQALRKERGAFDPVLNADLLRSTNENLGSSPFSGASVLRTTTTGVTAEAVVKLPVGTELGAVLATTRTSTNSSLAGLDPEYDTSGWLQVRQPLLKGFGPSARNSLSSAEQTVEAETHRYDDARLGVEADVETAYWNLYAAERDLAVQLVIRDRAVALLREASLRAQAGLVGPGEPANARVFLAEQEQAVLDREEGLEASSDRLTTLLGRRPDSNPPRFRATDEPPRDFRLEPEDSVLARARRDNRALAALRREVEGARLRAQAAAWDALPTLDLSGTFGGNGLSGEGQTVSFGSQTYTTDIHGGFGDTFRQVVRRRYPSWSAGVHLSFPLGARAGKGERDRLRAEVVRARERYESASRSLDEAARSACREMNSGARRLSLAKEGVDASLEQVRIGVLEYRSGRTTAFELVRLGADLAAAQQRYSQALVRTARASADLKRLTAEALTAGSNEKKEISQ